MPIRRQMVSNWLRLLSFSLIAISISCGRTDPGNSNMHSDSPPENTSTADAAGIAEVDLNHFNFDNLDLKADATLRRDIRQFLASGEMQREIRCFIQLTSSLTTMQREILVASGSEIIVEAGRLITVRTTPESILSLADLAFVLRMEASQIREPIN